MIGSFWQNLKHKRPLIHVINNYVSATDTANLLLACGARPIMADAPEEAAEISASCDGLCINLGTLSASRLEAMLKAGQTANTLDIPIVLDPVGVGASTFRMEAARKLLQNLNFSIIRGNASELRALLHHTTEAVGVDVSAKDRLDQDNLTQGIELARELSLKTSTTVLMTGAIDIITSHGKTALVRNGVPRMQMLTGIGCQLSALCAAFLASNPSESWTSALAAVSTMGVCAEQAEAMLKEQEGNGTFRTRLLDAFCQLNKEALEKEARYEIF